MNLNEADPNLELYHSNFRRPTKTLREIYRLTTSKKLKTVLDQIFNDRKVSSIDIDKMTNDNIELYKDLTNANLKLSKMLENENLTQEDRLLIDKELEINIHERREAKRKAFEQLQKEFKA